MLKQFYIGTTVEFVTAEYARSNRSTCKTCKQKIGKDQVRIGLMVDDDHFSTGQGTAWFHKTCFHYKPRHIALEINGLNKKIHGLNELNKKDQKEIISYLKEDLATLKEVKIKKKKRSAKSKSKPHQEDKSKSQKNDKSKPQKTQISKLKKVEPVEQKPVRRGRSLTQMQTVKPSTTIPKNIRPQRSVKAEFNPVEQKKDKKHVPKTFLSPTQITKFKEIHEEYQNKNVNELKQILRKNGHAKTGSKFDLVARCADGKQFGKIPICLKCGGGKLRFNRDKGQYNCPGYMEDTDFVHCGGHFTFEQIKRQEWVQ